MKKTVSLSVFVLLFFASSLFADAVALVTSFEGDVKLLRAGADKRETLLPATELSSGDVLTLGKNAKATVFFIDGFVSTLEEGEQLTVGTSSADTKVGTGANARNIADISKNSKLKSGFALSSKNDRDMAVQTTSMVRAEGVHALLPLGTVSSLNPIFVWYDSLGKSNETRDYVLIILNDDFEEIFRTVLKGVSHKLNTFVLAGFTLPDTDEEKEYSWDIYPAGKEPKQDAKYNLEGSFTVPGKSKRSLISSQIKMLEEEAIAMNMDKRSLTLLKALCYKNNRCYSESLIEYQAYYQEQQFSSYGLEEMILLCKKMGKNANFLAGFYKNELTKVTGKL